MRRAHALTCQPERSHLTHRSQIPCSQQTTEDHSWNSRLILAAELMKSCRSFKSTVFVQRLSVELSLVVNSYEATSEPAPTGASNEILTPVQTRDLRMNLQRSFVQIRSVSPVVRTRVSLRHHRLASDISSHPPTFSHTHTFSVFTVPPCAVRRGRFLSAGPEWKLFRVGPSSPVLEGRVHVVGRGVGACRHITDPVE